uniref:C-CAP/cofactor C-like domain-containing protein n=1 Tax=Graphocephala atropunctata TaxID=36148 RepID=A0A1B6L768_9HEMI
MEKQEMADNIEEERRGNLMDALIQREQDRKEKIKILKEEKELADPNETKKFNKLFEKSHKNILEKIKIAEDGKVEQENVLDYFNDLHKDVQALNDYLSVSTRFLSNFNVRKGLKTMEDVENHMKELEEKLMPRKKFVFKQKTKTVKKTSEGGVKKAPVDVVDAEIKKVFSYSTISCGFFNEKDKTLKLGSEEITKKDIELSGLENCTVFLYGNPMTVHISNVSSCKIFCGPVTTSVMMDSCRGCELVVACQQLRIHSTQDSRFYIHVTCKAIIEDSSDVQFAPYNLDYDNIQEHFKISGLNWSNNKWREIDDFNWLSIDEPSPNWREIREEDRIQNWSL